ncbi:MAG: tetratricopeptide repeat protein [Candidatus Omnitrophica bacterium]|nr:tetratricopeptide repeat protein [Candidatus Omnitrophota bacterium]MCF7894109.1 tetratricopeptide repeat protein [Candidatus Omnitrophota bacterium]
MKFVKLIGVVFLSVFIVLGNMPFVFAQPSSKGSGEVSSETLLNLLSESGKIIPDTESNSILVIDHSPNIAMIEEYLKMADNPSEQILIEARVVEVSLDKEHSLGVTWKLWKEGGLDLGGSATLGSAADSSLDQQIPFRKPYYKPISGSSQQDPFTIGIFDDNIEVVLKALTTQLDTDILSAPKIATKNNLRAKIDVRTTIPYLSEVEKEDQETESGTDTTYTYEYEYADEGVALEVTPLINPDRTITLDIHPEVKEITRFIAQVTPEGASGTPELPETDIRVTQTKVTVKEGQTVVIGGLIKEKTSHGITKVPLLGDIPFLGNLFKSTKEEKQKTELLIMVSPKIISTGEPLLSGKEKLTQVVQQEKIRKPQEFKEIQKEERVKVAEEEKKAEKEINREEKVKALHQEAQKLYKNKKFKKAKNLFQQILSLDPGNAKAKNYLKVKIPRSLRAIEELKKTELKKKEVKSQEKNTAEKLYSQGVSLYRQKQYQQAYKKFYKVKQLTGGYASVDKFLKIIPKLINVKNRQDKVNKALNVLQSDTE